MICLFDLFLVICFSISSCLWVRVWSSFGEMLCFLWLLCCGEFFWVWIMFEGR